MLAVVGWQGKKEQLCSLSELPLLVPLNSTYFEHLDNTAVIVWKELWPTWLICIGSGIFCVVPEILVFKCLDAYSEY